MAHAPPAHFGPQSVPWGQLCAGQAGAITSEDIISVLKLEMTKQSLGCDDAACLSNLGGALGAELMRKGGIALVDDVLASREVEG